MTGVFERPPARSGEAGIRDMHLDHGAVLGGAAASPRMTANPPSVAEYIVDRLVTAVALGLYVPDQQLPTERDLAAALGVSRTSAREALQRLAETGYLEVRRGRKGGYFVVSDWGPRSAEHIRRHVLSKWSEFEQIFDSRRLIEPLIAKTAAKRRTPADLDAISRALEAYAAAADRDASRRADAGLHLAIAGATRNHTLTRLSVDLRARISLDLGAEPYTDEVRRIAVEQHRQLVAAIGEQRAEDAGTIAEAHFALSEKLFRDLLERVAPGETEREGKGA